jgi:hypothetical protein
MLARSLIVLVMAAAPLTAHADCPVDVRELGPTRIEDLIDFNALHDDAAPTLSATLTAAGAVRVDSASAAMADTSTGTGTGSIGGEVAARRGALHVCASADLVDVRDGAAHITTSLQGPLMVMPFGVSFVADRAVRLPLSTRAEYYRAPLSRVAFGLSMSMLDLALSDDKSDGRLTALPFRVELGLASQDNALDRDTMDVEMGMLSIDWRQGSHAGQLRLFQANATWNRDRRWLVEDPRGFLRMSFIGLTLERERWKVDADGGMLALTGPEKCTEGTCARGWYLADAGVKLGTIEAHVRAERSPFMTADNDVAYEDRATVSATTRLHGFRANASVFAARAHRWLSGERAARAGVSAQLARELSHGFSEVLDGELVGMPRGSEMAGLGEHGARLLASLAWQTSYQRASSAR